MDPSLDGDKIIFMKGNRPAVGHSFNWWQATVSKMTNINSWKWKIGIEYQYNAFLVYLINNLAAQGLKIDDAIRVVVCDSKALGHYCNSPDAHLGDFENTGSRGILGIYDLANTFKMLDCSDGSNINF